jgi:ERCC4-type nuclease
MTPTILIDTREQTPLKFDLFPSEGATLPTGDYSVKGLEDTVMIERKSVSDLIGSLTSGRERFQREVQRMLAYRSRTLLIVGNGSAPMDIIKTHAYRSRVLPQAVLASLASIEAKGISIVTMGTPEAASQWIETLAFYAYRTQQAQAGNSKPPTPPELLARLVA